MEIARMNYYFTGILILMLTALAFCTTPAYPRNEYLNDGTNTCSTALLTYRSNKESLSISIDTMILLVIIAILVMINQ